LKHIEKQIVTAIWLTLPLAGKLVSPQVLLDIKLYHASNLWYPPFYTFPWLPVLSNIEPPALQRKAATDKLVEKIVKHDSWSIQPDILSPPKKGHHYYD